jgi:hypothetical protein
LVPELAGHGEPEARTTDPDAARFALFDGVAEVLFAAARERPLVLVLEELHAADHTSLLLLDLLAPRLAGAPLLVVGTLRPHDAGTDSRAQDLLSRVGRRGEVLELSGLGVEATRALASASAGGELADAAVVALQERTEGNPFFVQSLARVLGDATDPGAPFPLPTGVRDTIARRLAPLSEGTRIALAAASVLGRDFTAGRLARLRGVEPAEALALVDLAVRAGLIVNGAAPGDARRGRRAGGLAAASRRSPGGSCRCVTLALLAGRFDEAERVIAEAESVGRRARGRGAVRYSILQRRELLYLRGGPEAVEREVREVAAEATEVWGATLMHLLATTGRLEEARAGFEQLAAADFGGPVDEMAALSLLSRCAEVCTALGDAERAEPLYERLLRHPDRWLVFAGGPLHRHRTGEAWGPGHDAW